MSKRTIEHKIASTGSGEILGYFSDGEVCWNKKVDDVREAQEQDEYGDASTHDDAVDGDGIEVDEED